MRPGIRFIVSLGALLVPAAVAVAATDRWLERQIMHPAKSAYHRLLTPEPRLRNVVFGTSLARWGIDTRRLGRPAAPFYNLALDGSGPAYLAPYYRLLRRYHGVPERVVIGVGWTFLGRFGRDRRLEDDAEFLPWPDLAREALAPGTDVGRLAGQRFPFFKHHPWVLRGVPANMRGPDRWRATSGFNEGPAKSAPVWRLAPLPRDYGVDPVKVPVLAAFLDELRRDGVRVALVLTPTYAGVAGDRTREAAVFERLAAPRGLVFLDYQGGPRGRAAGLAGDPTNYWDMEHLTRAGSRRLTAVLDRDLAAAGFYR